LLLAAMAALTESRLKAGPASVFAAWLLQEERSKTTVAKQTVLGDMNIYFIIIFFVRLI